MEGLAQGAELLRDCPGTEKPVLVDVFRGDGFLVEKCGDALKFGDDAGRGVGFWRKSITKCIL